MVKQKGAMHVVVTLEHIVFFPLRLLLNLVHMRGNGLVACTHSSTERQNVAYLYFCPSFEYARESTTSQEAKAAAV